MGCQNYQDRVHIVDTNGEIHEVPSKDWKSKYGWRRQFRRVLPNAVPSRDYMTNASVYSLEQTVAFTPTPRQLAYREFETLYRFRSCDPEKWIYARWTDDGEERRTEYAARGWHGTYLQRLPGKWAVAQHLSGKKMLGICAGDMTQVVFFDLDNHGCEKDPHWHLDRVMTLATDLATRYPKMKLTAEVNPRNASSKLQITFARPHPVESEIKPWLEELQKNLHTRYAHLRYDQMEMFPLSCRQVLIPLRPDKITITDSVLDKIQHYCLDEDRRRKPIEIYSVEEYIRYLRDDGRKLDLQVLRSQLVQSLDWDGLAKVRTPAKPKKKPGQVKEGMLRYKNKFLAHITDFVEGNIAPDTIGKYTTPLERYLMMGEGLSSTETQSLIAQVIARHADVGYSTRLSGKPSEFWRSDTYTRKAIAKANGYQADPALSHEKLMAVKSRWHAQHINVVKYLQTGDRKHIQRQVNAPRMKVHWTAQMLDQATELADLAHCSLDMSKEILEVVAGHVRNGREMAIEYLRGMLLGLGLRCKHHSKAVEIRQWLERTGWIIKVRNYWYKDGRGMGNYYMLGLLVEEEAREAAKEGAAPVSILSVPSVDKTDLWKSKIHLDYRRLKLEDDYHKRWRQAACA